MRDLLRLHRNVNLVVIDTTLYTPIDRGALPLKCREQLGDIDLVEFWFRRNGGKSVFAWCETVMGLCPRTNVGKAHDD